MVHMCLLSIIKVHTTGYKLQIKTCTTLYTLLQCSLRYTGNSLSPGWYGVALQIEDFASPSSTTPLSSVPLQFLVNVYYTGSACASRPELVGSTVADGVCIGVPFGTTWSNRIIAQSGSSTVRYYMCISIGNCMIVFINMHGSAII